MSAVAGFLPSTHAPLFSNTRNWPPDAHLEVSIPGLPTINVGAAGMALCGGMCFLTRDIFQAGTPQLRSRDSSRIPADLAEYLLARLVASFAGDGVVAWWLYATQSLDHDTLLLGPGLYHLTAVGICPKVMAEIDAGYLCPIGIVLTQSYNPYDIFQNHVVMVYAYEMAGDVLHLHVYDPNRPYRPGNARANGDDVVITIDTSTPEVFKPITTNGTENPARPGTIRGFYPLPYVFADPAPAYIDDAIVSVRKPPPATMKPGQVATAELAALNCGSTSWRPQAGYRMGTVPHDSRTWGLDRVDLQHQIDPDQEATFTFSITAPAGRGRYPFGWSMLRENVAWFGSESAKMDVAVGLDDAICAVLKAQHKELAANLKQVQDAMNALDPNDAGSRAEMKELAKQAVTLGQAIRGNESAQSANGCAPG